MLKFEIAFDEEKIAGENRYDIVKMKNIVDGLFSEYGLRKVGEGVYVDRGDENDFANMWVVFWALYKVDWFRDNVSKVIWHENNDIENVLQIIKEKRLEILQS